MLHVVPPIIDCRYYKRPVIPLLCGFIVGILGGAGLSGHVLTASFIVVLSLGCVLVLFLYDKSIRFTPLILFSALGYLFIQPYAESYPEAHHIYSYLDGQKYNIKGSVETRPKKKGYGQTFILKTETVSGQDMTHRDISVKIRLTISGMDHVLKQGDKISFKSKLRPFRNFSNPGGFDYERYMRFKGVWARAYAKKDDVVFFNNNSHGLTNNARFAVESLIDRSIESIETGGVLKALITGNRNTIDHHLRDEFSRTGTGHLLAISGLHVGIVGSASFLIFCWLASFFEGLLWNGYVKKIAGLLSLIPILVYGALSGMSPSTQRAVIMVFVLLMTYSLEAEHDVINTLAWAALIILAISPVSLFFVSFQLSFSAVFFIVYGMSKLRLEEDFHGNSLKTVKKILKSYIVVSIFAFAGTLPLVLYYFNQMSVIGIFANLILIPLIGFLVVPVGLFAVFVYPISQVASEVLIKTAGFFLENSLSIVHALSDVSFSAIKTTTPTILEIICYYILLLIGLHLISKKEDGHQFEWEKLKIIICVVLIVIIFDIGFWVNKRFFHDDLRFTVLDVGQGSSALLEFPGGECMLVDGGGFSDNSAFDVGEKIIAPFLWGKKIGKIHTVVLSHPESDHLNGLLYVLENFKVEKVWTNGQIKKTKGYRRFRSIIERKNINLVNVNRLSDPIYKNGVALNVLWPAAEIPGRKMKTGKKSTNNNSIVLRVESGSVSFLLPGDIMAQAEKNITELVGDDLHSTILVAPHHGSKTSSSQEFLEMVNPEIVIISCGWKNRFKMPHANVLQRLNELKTTVYRTDHHGAVLISTLASKNRIETVLAEDPQW